MPLELLSNYKQFHQNSEPIQTSEAIFERRPDGQVKLSFQTPGQSSDPEAPRLSYTAMIMAVSSTQKENLLVYGFSSEGYPVYPDQVNGHFLWDVLEAHMFNPDCPCLNDPYDDDEDFEIIRKRRRRKKKPSHSKTSCKSYSLEQPDDPSLSQPLLIYKKALKWIEKEDRKAIPQESSPSPSKHRSCLMFSSSSQSYQESFPLLEKQTDLQTKVVSQSFVQSPITSSGQPDALKQYEPVLNWQTQNANAQNQSLYNLGRKIDKVTTQVTKT